MSALKNPGTVAGGEFKMAGGEEKQTWTSRGFPLVRTRDGRLLDSTADTIVMYVCREMDRALLRSIKDAPFPSYVVNYQDINGLTPLAYLSFRGDFIMVKMLCEMKHVNINLADNEGNTPLMIASQAGHSNVVSFLLDKFKVEIEINKRNSFGFTAAMKAALQGRVKCLRLLLSAGANISLRDPVRGFSALEWAELCGRKSCVELLRQHMKATRKSSKRLSQTLNETENWLRKRFGNMYVTTPPATTSQSDLVARSTASSTLCVSLPVLTGVSVPDGQGDRNKALSIPTIYVTPEHIS